MCDECPPMCTECDVDEYGEGEHTFSADQGNCAYGDIPPGMMIVEDPEYGEVYRPLPEAR